MSATTPLYTVAVFAPGQRQLNIVIDDLDCDAAEVHAQAVSWARRALQALADVHFSQWQSSIISQTEVETLGIKTL